MDTRSGHTGCPGPRPQPSSSKLDHSSNSLQDPSGAGALVPWSSHSSQVSPVIPSSAQPCPGRLHRGPAVSPPCTWCPHCLDPPLPSPPHVSWMTPLAFLPTTARVVLTEPRHVPWGQEVQAALLPSPQGTLSNALTGARRSVDRQAGDLTGTGGPAAQGWGISRSPPAARV